MELLQAAEAGLKKVKTLGADQCMATVSVTEAKEFNIEANKLTLLRTTFDQSIRLRTVLDQKQATSSGNQLSESAIHQLATDSVNAAKASPQDEGSGFAGGQGEKNFSFGSTPSDDEWMYSRLQKLLKEREDLFPKVILEGSTIKFVKTNTAMLTSNGTKFTSDHGHYEGFVMFTAKEGKKTSSFNYIGFNIAADQAGKDISLMKTANLQELLKQSSQQIEVKKVPAKFVGDLIVTPHCMQDLTHQWLDYLGPARLLKKSSFFMDKLEQKVASSLWTLTASPMDSNFASRKFWTTDGYESQNEVIFDKGVLKNYVLNHFAATKLKQKISRSEGSYLRLNPGNTKLSDMISSVKKGILLCRLSAGMPAENGDISGVAKNSYYIEDGQILFPLGETMLATNLASMLSEIKDISQESVKSGYWDFPWVKFGGATVS